MLNLGIIGVLYPAKNETLINDTIKSLNGKPYWLPWGNRFETLIKTCNFICKNGLWKRETKQIQNCQTYYLYSAIKENPYRLIFFHHNSKSQNGTGLIYYKYYIDKVIIGTEIEIPIIAEKLPYKPLKPNSRVWFSIKEVKRLGRDGYDFAGNFDIHPLVIGKERRQVNAKTDGGYLYYQVLPVMESLHKDRNCNCLICR